MRYTDGQFRVRLDLASMDHGRAQELSVHVTDLRYAVTLRHNTAPAVTASALRSLADWIDAISRRSS